MPDILAITKALADWNRLRVLMALRKSELCVCQVIAVLGLAPSTVSKHMYVLRRARLVEARKEGRWVYYRFPDRDVPKSVEGAIQWVLRNLADDPQISKDARKLEAILKMDPERLCKNRSKK
jgi:DNA-binding transcriptional ArsR family regulator